MEEHLIAAKIKLDPVVISIKYNKISAYELYSLALKLETLEALAKYLDCSENTVRFNILKKLPNFPSRPRATIKNKFIEYIGFKCCSKCKNILNLQYFYTWSNSLDSKDSWCIECRGANYIQNKQEILSRNKTWRISNKGKVTAIKAKSRAKRNKRVPIWADIEKIKEIYKNCPPDMQVDHIIPLAGKNVSGLHVHYNLQYLTPEENRKKSNKYDDYTKNIEMG